MKRETGDSGGTRGWKEPKKKIGREGGKGTNTTPNSCESLYENWYPGGNRGGRNGRKWKEGRRKGGHGRGILQKSGKGENSTNVRGGRKRGFTQPKPPGERKWSGELS